MTASSSSTRGVAVNFVQAADAFGFSINPNKTNVPKASISRACRTTDKHEWAPNQRCGAWYIPRQYPLKWCHVENHLSKASTSTGRIRRGEVTCCACPQRFRSLTEPLSIRHCYSKQRPQASGEVPPAINAVPREHQTPGSHFQQRGPEEGVSRQIIVNDANYTKHCYKTNTKCLISSQNLWIRGRSVLFLYLVFHAQPLPLSWFLSEDACASAVQWDTIFFQLFITHFEIGVASIRLTDLMVPALCGLDLLCSWCLLYRPVLSTKPSALLTCLCFFSADINSLLAASPLWPKPPHFP